MASTQAREVNVPPQVPLNTCKTASLNVPGVTVTIWLVPAAVNEYHTSSSAPLPTHAAWDCVAETVVPEVLVVQVVVGLTVSDTAPPQLSLAGPAGGVVIHTENVPWLVPLE